MRDNEIDNQIDETARRLTAGAPGGDLRARVLARVETAGEGPAKAGHPVLARKWIAAPLALAAALVIAVWTTREAHQVHEVQQAHEVQSVQQAPQIQQVRDVPQIAEVQRASAVHAVNRVNPVNTVTFEESPFAPARLDIAPLTMTPALVEAIPAAAPIVVADLAVAPIEVRAIDETVAPDALAQ